VWWRPHLTRASTGRASSSIFTFYDHGPPVMPSVGGRKHMRVLKLMPDPGGFTDSFRKIFDHMTPLYWLGTSGSFLQRRAFAGGVAHRSHLTARRDQEAVRNARRLAPAPCALPIFANTTTATGKPPRTVKIGFRGRNPSSDSSACPVRSSRRSKLWDLATQ
jgi:hypothetical protein